MTRTKSETRWTAFVLAALMLLGLLPISANAATINDGSKTATIGPVERYYFLRTTAGTVLGASAYQYTTNDGLTGPAYCIDHGLNYASRALPITGKYTASVATAAAFATAYPQHSMATFLGRYPNDTMLEGLTEQEYAYATQLAVWATLGQLAIEGTAFTNGRETIAQPTGNAQQMRIFHVIQLILDVAKSWTLIYQPGMYICAEDGKLGGNISIPADMTLDFAADNQRYGFKREVIGGASYYTREYTFASATSTYYSGYNIELWAENAPAGTIFTDTDNHELPRGTFQETATWTLPVEIKDTTLNENGFEYSGKAKLCLPVETTPNSGEITVRCGAYVMQYDIYLAKNEIVYEQSYIIADPSKGTMTADCVLNWGSELTENGDLQVRKVNGSGQPLSGATFTLTGADGSSRTGTTNDEGIIEWHFLDPSHTYTLTETAAPAGYALVDPVTVRIEAARVNYVTVQDSTQKRLTVKKIDRQTGYSLASAVMAFEQIDGDYYTTGVTDPAGVIQMDADQLPVGSYKVYELTAPAGYELDSTAQTVSWTGRNDVTLTFRNVRKPTLIIYKCDTDNLRSLPGATFAVYRNGQLVTTVTTNDNGLAYVPDVTTGYYTVKETVAPSGYVLDSTEHSVYVDNYNPATTDDPRIVIPNSALPMLRIKKYDAQTMQPLSGVTFAVYRDTELVGEYTTGASGEVLLYSLDPGTYLVRETAVPGSHVINSMPQEIELESGTQNYTLVFLNYVKPGIHLMKLDSQTMTPLANARFRITEIGGTFSQEYTTGTDGGIDLTGLAPGSYAVEELAAPDGYLIDDARRVIRINAGENAAFVFTDTRKPTLTVLKYDAQREKLLSGAAFRIAKIEDGTHYLDRITDAQGRITIENLDPGVYSVQEIDAPSGYIINDTEFHVQLYPGQPAQLVVCDEKKPDLKIVKKDADTGAALAGATFRISRADGSTLTTEQTDANGEIFLKELDPGVYQITEVSPPSGYLPAEQPTQLITLTGNKLGTVVFENHAEPSLTVNKIDSITRAPIPSVKFHISYASNQTFTGEINDLGDFITDQDGRIVIDELHDGWYRVTEVEAPTGYAIAENATQEFYILAGRGKSVTFENTPLSALCVFKYDSVTGEAVKNALFQVKYLSGSSGTGGTVIGTYKTSANGSFTVTGLQAGTYIVEELASDSGHVIDAAPQTAYISGEQQDVVQLFFGNAPKGGVLIKKIDSATHAPLSDVRFFITDSSGAVLGNNNGYFITDSAGLVLIDNLDPGLTVIARETAAKDGYVLDDTPQTVKVKSGETVTLEFRNAPNGGLVIQKRDSITGAFLSGAVFRVTTSTGAYADNYGGYVSSNGLYTTGANGLIRLYDLTPGTYVVTEEKAPDGYVRNSQPQTVRVNADDTQTLVFENPPMGKLLIQKIDAATHEPLSDVQFLVTDSTGAAIGSSGGYYTTDSAGTILISGLIPSTTLIVRETRAKPGYILDETAQTAVIQSGETTALEFRNIPKGALVVQKFDSVTGLPLAGARFKITTAAGELVAANEGQTSSNGLYVTDEYGQIALSKLDPDTYIVTEDRAPDYYKLDETAQTVVVNGADTQVLHFYDEPLCTLTVYKRDSETKKPLAGAEFTAVYSDGAIIGHYTSDRDGKIIVSGLMPDASVIVTEDKAPTGYIKDSTPQTVLVRSGAVNTLTFDNEPVTTLVLRKYVTGTDYTPLAGVAFRVTDGNGGAVGPDDGVYYTDHAGEIVLSDLTPGMTVIAREIKAPDGYALDGTPQDIEIKAGTVQQLTFWNARQGALVIRKLDSITNAPISGAEFSVRYADGRFVDNADGHISSAGVYRTNANGEIVISGITGTVVVTEEKAPDGYILDPDNRAQTVTVSPDDTQTLVFYNTPVGGLIITKSDEETGARIPGVLFEVRKMSGEIVGQFTTDRNGVIRLPGLESGWYEVTELKAASGYVLDAMAQSVEVKDGQTATLALTNRRTSRVLIHKIDADTGKGIYGVTFLLYDSDHNPIGEYVSDQDGYVYIDDGLADGRYYLREIKAADGYIPDDELKTIYIRYGATSEITWRNTAVRGQIQIVKKSADDNPINGLPAGTLLEGAVFEITDKAGNIVDTVRTDRNGCAASRLLPLSRYTVREISAPQYYAVNPTVMTAYLEYAGQIVRFEVEDESVATGVSIKKTGYTEVMPGQPIRYTVTGIANTSTVALGSFYWRDTLPGQITLTQLVTGTYNQALAYKIVYKTNLSGDSYRTLADNLSTAKNYVLDARPATLGLAANERITEIMYVFGTVKAGFAEVETAYISGTVNGGLSNGSSIVNVADVGGLYNGMWIQAVSRWNTSVYVKTSPLPKTGY